MLFLPWHPLPYFPFEMKRIGSTNIYLSYCALLQSFLLMKAECGSAFTNKLEGMFLDIELTRNLMKNYQVSYRATSFPIPDPSLFACDLPSYHCPPIQQPWMFSPPPPFSTILKNCLATYLWFIIE